MIQVVRSQSLIFFLDKIVSLILIVVFSSVTCFADNEREFSPGNKDALNDSVRKEIYKRHFSNFPQPGIDIPEGGIAKGRIAIDSDGNVFASDDLGAIPFGISILERTNHFKDIVHISYNNNPNPDRHANVAKDNPNLTQDKEFKTIMDSTAHVFGLDKTLLYNFSIPAEKENAIANLVNEINISSADNPLYIIEAGAFLYLYQALAISDSSKHRYVTIITHSGWNDIECYDSEKNENIIDILRDFSSVKVDYIPDQNRGLRRKAGWDKINWLKESDNPKDNWIYTCAKKGDPNRWGFYNLSSEVDVSDAGMFYYLVTGKTDANLDVVPIR